MTDETDRRRKQLAKRLDDGYARIDQAVAEGKDVAAWETFWLSLLQEYEAVVDEMLTPSQEDTNR